MENIIATEYYKVIIIGAGQAGLNMGYYLSQKGIPFLIIDANKNVGDSWRKRWDTLHLFTPAQYDGLPGMPFPAMKHTFPSKDEFADYLEEYAGHFNLPVRTNTYVTSLSRDAKGFIINAGDKQFKADNVVVAMNDCQHQRVPAFAKELDPGIVQIFSSKYKNPSQLQDGNVLVIGAGNSGCEIALEVSKTHRTWLAGRDTGHIPFRIKSKVGHVMVPFVLRFMFHRIFTTGTFIGRKIRPKAISTGGPLIRIKPKEITEAGIIRVPKVTGVIEGLPVLQNKEVLDVKNIIWCTGYYPRFSWIDLPVFKNGRPVQERGVVDSEPGLYFLGLHFLYAMSSGMIHGVDRDAKYIAGEIEKNGQSSGLPNKQLKEQVA
ncbi:MAG TPA: NAD(P)/FAD-dependent oxidoreductase [Hanamia sp.]|nr:NAD(P)/FAD-dependent oxidoreductase [Hanamia sp.]